MIWKRVENCRSCGTKLHEVISFGEVRVIDMGDKNRSAPLELVYCPQCTLLQLAHTVPADDLFREYYYKSGVNKTIRDNLEEIVKESMKRVPLKAEDVVVDIGANDGTLLRNYPKGVVTLGYEPAENLKNEAIVGTSGITPHFFTLERAKLHADKAKIITAISMFYDLDDPNDFLEGVKYLLADDGIFVIQQNYLPAMLRNNAFDNIVHEHLEYYSVRSLGKLLDKHQLWIEDVEFNDINGGSFRVYVRHDEYPNTPRAYSHDHSVSIALRQESEIGLNDINTYKEFAHRVEVVSHKLNALMKEIFDSGKLIYIAGASTRGNTLINVAQIGKYIKFAVERNPAKWGRTYNGIPIVSEKFAEDFPPDYYLVLPWHFASEMFMREQPYLRKGGKMIFPLPKPAIVSVEEL